MGDRFPRWKGMFFFATLGGQALWYARFDQANPGKIEMLGSVLHEQFGRLRVVTFGPDGYLCLTTSSRDKRGVPTFNDDRVLRLATIATSATEPAGK